MIILLELYFYFLKDKPPYGVCDNYALKNNVAKDWQGSGWYRIMKKAGNQLLERHSKLKSKGQCNSKERGWLNGSHPKKPGQTVTREVCFDRKKKDEDELDNPCDFKTTIKITNCGHFYVYSLNNLDGFYTFNGKRRAFCPRYCTISRVE